MAGRFAPSPTSALHLGTLRTALVSWLVARQSGRRWLVRIEDLDQERVAAAGGVARRQLEDLAALGLVSDSEPWWQSGRMPAYRAALDVLRDDLYECYCTRREIAQSASAPHGDGYRPYPGTCRDLSPAERARRRAARPPALRIRAVRAVQTVHDLWAGEVSGSVDDFVLLRNDGVPAYNFAVVVDDLAQGVDQVVRGDDLLSSSPRQAWLAVHLGGVPPNYAHVPLAVSAEGRRLAKRDGAVTLADLRRQGLSPGEVLTLLAASLDLAELGEPVSLPTLLDRFDPARLPRSPWVVVDPTAPPSPAGQPA